MPNKTSNMTVIPNSHGTGKSIYGIMVVMQGDLQGRKVNSKVNKSPLKHLRHSFSLSRLPLVLLHHFLTHPVELERLSVVI